MKLAHRMYQILLSEWQYKLTLLFTGLFLYQYIIWFSSYWLPETIVITNYTLIAVFLIEAIHRLNWMLRRLLQLLTLLAIHAYVLDYVPIGAKIDSIRAFTEMIDANMLQVVPYLWFSLSCWVVYLAIIWWIKVKIRIYSLILCSVILFSLVDSFSLFVLWDQVAVMIFSGLVLLIINHFEQFRVKHASSWAYLTEYPMMIIGPIVLLISVIMIAGVLAPNIRPVITDPYTAYKHWVGETVVTGGKGGRDVQFFGGPEYTSSGYRRDDHVLGGGFQFDYTPIMTVETSHASYWRGETRSEYTGAGWVSDQLEEEASTTPIVSHSMLPQDEAFDISQQETEEIRQTFTILRNESYPVLFAAFSVQSLEKVDGSEEGSAVFAEWAAYPGELRWDEEYSESYPRTYTVTSQVPVLDEEGLRASSTSLAESQNWQPFLHIPDTVPKRVSQLAKDITEDETNAYDKVKKIEAYLQENFPYTNQPDVSKARSPDFVDSFLFEIQEGYCDYYSTAMAILTRSIGLPTRWVKGYSKGQPPMEDQIMGLMPLETFEMLGAGKYVVRNSDAHSWVEVYFAGWGWIPFEPTAGFVLPSITPTTEYVFEAGVIDVSVAEEDKHFLEWKLAVYVGLIVVISAFILVLMIIYRWNPLGVLRSLGRFTPRKSANQQVITEVTKFLRYSRRKGYVHEEHETIREAMKRWGEQRWWLNKELTVLLSIFEKAKYSKHAVSAEEIEKSAKAIRKLREEMI